jgi:hypothetical protein
VSFQVENVDDAFPESLALECVADERFPYEFGAAGVLRLGVCPESSHRKPGELWSHWYSPESEQCSESICVNPRASLFLSALKFLSRVNLRRLVWRRNLTQIRTRDKRGCTQMGQCGSDRTGALPTHCRLAFVCGRTLNRGNKLMLLLLRGLIKQVLTHFREYGAKCQRWQFRAGGARTISRRRDD